VYILSLRYAYYSCTTALFALQLSSSRLFFPEINDASSPFAAAALG
jgi:hypothetical protein